MHTRSPHIARLMSVVAAMASISACSMMNRPDPAPLPRVRTAHIRDRAQPQRTLMRAPSGDTTERESGRGNVNEHAISLADGSPGLVYVNSGHYAGGDYTDTLVVRRDDLAPIWEHVDYPQRRWEKTIQFHGASLTQTNHLGDTTRSFNLRFPRRVFAFSEVDLVVRSLPYAAGYHDILPLYSEGDDSLELDTIAVVGTPGPTITLRFADPVLVVTYVVDSATRRITSYDLVNKRTGVRGRRVVG